MSACLYACVCEWVWVLLCFTFFAWFHIEQPFILMIRDDNWLSPIMQYFLFHKLGHTMSSKLFIHTKNNVYWTFVMQVKNAARPKLIADDANTRKNLHPTWKIGEFIISIEWAHRVKCLICEPYAKKGKTYIRLCEYVCNVQASTISVRFVVNSVIHFV